MPKTRTKTRSALCLGALSSFQHLILSGLLQGCAGCWQGFRAAPAPSRACVQLQRAGHVVPRRILRPSSKIPPCFLLHTAVGWRTAVQQRGDVKHCQQLSSAGAGTDLNTLRALSWHGSDTSLWRLAPGGGGGLPFSPLLSAAEHQSKADCCSMVQCLQHALENRAQNAQKAPKPDCLCRSSRKRRCPFHCCTAAVPQ